MSLNAIHQIVDAAHAALWDRFVDEYGIILDYVGPNGELHRPTPEECFLSKPNGLSWTAPNENGAFFGGVYLAACVQRYQASGLDRDRQQAHRIAQGLMLLASVGAKPGFIARGVSTDGHSHFSIGSNDQTTPWLYGMWRYVTSGVPDEAEKAAIIAKITEVVRVLHGSDWQTPCDRPPFDFRNCLTHWDFEAAPRLLWLCRMMLQLTGESEWEERYEAALQETNPSDGPDRLEICRRGMVFDQPWPHSWTGSSSVSALRALWELEDDPRRKQAFAEGLAHSADLAATSLPLALQFDNDDARPFSCNWRVVNELWEEQQTVEQAVALGRKQYARLAQESPRSSYEARLVREPLFAAWVIALCPDRTVVEVHLPAIIETLCHYQYDQLYLSQFFAAELAYYQLLSTT